MSNAYDVVRQFEKAVAEYTGAPYVVAVESCSAAMLLSFIACDVKKAEPVMIPKITYPSVPCSIINAGGRVGFDDREWQEDGYYYMQVEHDINHYFNIVDSAKYFARNMYEQFTGDLVCLSFHGKKHIKIGRGGAIFTDNKDMYERLRWMRFDGRHEMALDKDVLAGIGYNCYLQPEQAASHA